MITLVSFCLLFGVDDSKKTEPSLIVQEVRQIVAVIVDAAEANQRMFNGRMLEDQLADQYVRRAAEAAVRAKSTRGFLIALGVAVDESSMLRRNPLIRPFLMQIESDVERQRRLRALGKPSLRKRNDWLMHYWISAALTAHAGPEIAEQFGLAKELMDSRGTSGFSFADLAADYAGIALARALLANDDNGLARLKLMATDFRGSDYLPAIEDLEDGLPAARFEQKYGGLRDERFLTLRDSIKLRVEKAKGVQWYFEGKSPAQAGKKK